MKIRICTRSLTSVSRASGIASIITCAIFVWEYLQPEIKLCRSNAKSGIWRVLDDTLTNGLDGSNNMTLDTVIGPALAAYDRGDSIGLSQDTLNNQHKFFLVEPSIELKYFHRATMFVFVQSSPHHVDLRARIRASWGGNGNTRRVCVIFAMGLTTNLTSNDKEAVAYELQTEKDILLLNMDDSYNNLTYKGLLTMTWIASKGPRIKYVFKTDDDVVLNIFAWFQIIDVLEKKAIECTIVGHVWLLPAVLRDGKWLTTYEEYTSYLFPSFCSGSGYLMTRTAMVNIVSAAYHLRFLVRDDLFFTGVIRKQLNITLYTVPTRSYILRHTHFKSKELRSKAVLLIHDVSTANEMWRAFKYNSVVKLMPRYLKVSPVFESGRGVPKSWLVPATYACPSLECGAPLARNRDVLYIKT